MASDYVQDAILGLQSKGRARVLRPDTEAGTPGILFPGVVAYAALL